jgi:hypothetical protein
MLQARLSLAAGAYCHLVDLSPPPRVLVGNHSVGFKPSGVCDCGYECEGPLFYREWRKLYWVHRGPCWHVAVAQIALPPSISYDAACAMWDQSRWMFVPLPRGTRSHMLWLPVCPAHAAQRCRLRLLLTFSRVLNIGSLCRSCWWLHGALVGGMRHSPVRHRPKPDPDRTWQLTPWTVCTWSW